MKRPTKSIIPCCVSALIGNVLILYFIFSQISGFNSISDEWQSVKNRSFETAIHLAEVERDFGYAGFIHHFKNYIIRQTDVYYAKAVQSQAEVTSALDAFKQLSALSTADLEYIRTIEKTLAEYGSRLAIAKAQSGRLSVTELDRLVKVDDSGAEHALNQLRAEILPRLQTEKAHLNETVTVFKERTLLIGLSLIPLLMFLTFVTIKTIRKQATNVNELVTIFNASPDGIIYVSEQGVISKANKAALALFGYQHQEFIGLQIEDLIAPQLKDKHVAHRQDFMSKEQTRIIGSRDAHVKGVKKDGSIVELSIAIASKKLGEKMVDICVIKDLTNINTLQRESDSDHLTSLSNRRHFDGILKKELNRAIRTGREASLFLIDLDCFKQLNDEQGI